MDVKSADGQSGQYKRFSGASLDGKELRKWRLWCEAKMASQKDMELKQRGPWVFTLLDGLALEAVEHLTIEQLTKEDGDKEIWKILEERFPDKLQHDLLAECLKEVFSLAARDGESMAEWASRVQESFSKCRRKVSVDFPSEARGWVVLNCSGLSADQRAIVTAKSGGILKFETVVASLRSCFPDYVVNSKTKKVSPVMVVAHQDEVNDEPPPEMDAGDAVVFEEVEAFLSDHGIQHTDVEPGDFDETETAEILAATWKERRTEIAKLQRSRNFRQAVKVQQQFKEDASEVKKRTRCRRCNKLGHWARECPLPKGGGKGSGSSDKPSSVSTVAMVVEREGESEHAEPEEVLLVSSPGFGIIDSGCGKTLIGQETLNQMMRMYQAQGLTQPVMRRQENLFAFGNNKEELTEFVVELPIGINGKAGRVEAAIIRGPAPLLLSRGTMKSLGASLNFSDSSLSLEGGPSQPLKINSAGQYMIDVMDFPSLPAHETMVISDDKLTENAIVPKSTNVTEYVDMNTHLVPHGDDCSCCSGFEVLSGDSRTLTRREQRCVMSRHAAWTKGQSKCVVAELFSPPRFALAAQERGAEGLSFDIKQGWDLLDKKVQQQVSGVLEKKRPELLVLCPECKHWGGWYRLNQTKLPLWEQIHNKRVAEKQAQFCVDEAKRQIKRGGRVLIEHPWSSGLWEFAPMKKLLKQMHLCKASMCAYGLKCPDTGIPVLKPTGLAVSHDDMVELAKCCPGHAQHRVIAGRCKDGQNISAKAAVYTSEFVHTWLSSVCPSPSLCAFASVQDPATPSELIQVVHECCAQEEGSPENLKQIIKKLHNNLGHPQSADLIRVLRNAGATSQALEAARLFTCEICTQRQRPTPCLPASAHSVVDFNHRVGIDVKILPGWAVNQKVKCLNIVDWATSMQIMVPFHQQETGEVLRQLFMNHWMKWAGPPVELLMDPARTNQSELLVSSLENAGIRVLTIAAEAHNQLGKVEKHGHLFEVVFEKVLDQCQPGDKESWEQCVVQTMNAKNEMLNQQGLSPYQHVFGRNPRVPFDVLQENPDAVSGTVALHDSSFAKSQAVRTAARVSLVQAQDEQTLRTALNARPRAEREFLPGDFVCYWRTQKYQRGVRIVGGRWYGTAIVMGKVGRNLLIYHRRNMFKVSPEHLRHATLDERAVAQADGRELLGIAAMVGEDGNLRTSQYVDLSKQELPEMPEQLQQGPEASSNAVDISAATVPSQAEALEPAALSTGAPGAPEIMESNSPESSSVPIPDVVPQMSTRAEPFHSSSSSSSQVKPHYGPIRFRHSTKKPEVLYRPPEMVQSDFQEASLELSREKRAASREPSSEPAPKHGKCSGDCMLALAKTVECVEVFLAGFLKKKLQTELHHSNNPSDVQELIDESKVVEWSTLLHEKGVIEVINPKQADEIRTRQPNRIMSSRFVITKKVEDGQTRMKSRWCLRGHHDPDLVKKVLSGKCHSPTLSQLGRNVLLQLIVSHKWTMNLGDIKGAFLEADVSEQLEQNPVFAELPPGGVPGVAPGSLVRIRGNVYGANDAPHNWFVEFNQVAQKCGFSQSRFDSCVYYCYNAEGTLEGVLGAHVDDTLTGGSGSTYDRAIAELKARFPFRKWRSGHGEFLGVEYTQDPTTMEIEYQQKDYALNIQPIKLSKERAREHWKPANDREISALRAVNGALGWLSGQSRPDLCVQTSMSQQCFPNPTVENLLQANQAVRRARQHSDMTIKVPYIPPSELTVCFWSDAAFANAVDHRTQGGWIVGLTSQKFSQGHDCPLSFVGWKSYRLPRVVSSTLGGEAQCFASASGIAEWCMLILAEALDGPFLLSEVDEVLSRRQPIGMSDCRSLYDHLVTLGSGGTLDDKRVAIDIAVIRQCIQRTRLQPRWVPTDRMVADGLTKDKGEPHDLLRSVLRNGKYQLADEQLVLDRKKEERHRRQQLGKSRKQQHDEQQRQSVCTSEKSEEAEPCFLIWPILSE